MSGVSHFTPAHVTSWHQAEGRQIHLGDVLDAGNSDHLGAGFARYAAGESNAWVVTYDEVLVVTDGEFTVTSAAGDRATAGVGELIFLRNGTELEYSAGPHGASVVYVTYPSWVQASDQSLLDTFHPVEGMPIPDNRTMLEGIWGPLERGESDDFQPFFDALADDVVLELSIGEARGKQAVIDYFAAASAAIDFRPFERPLEYFAAGDRVVVLGDETFKVRATGVTHQAPWAWAFDLRDGRITRIVSMQDLSGIAGTIRSVLDSVG